MQINRNFRYCCLLALALVIAGCGFKLRGNLGADLSGKSFVIAHPKLLDDQPLFRQFSRELMLQLKRHGARVAFFNLTDGSVNEQYSNAEEGSPIIISKLSSMAQGASRDSSGRAGEFEITLRLDYLDRQPSDLALTNTLSVSASYYHDYLNSAASRVSQNNTQARLISELTQQFLLRLSSMEEY